MDEYRIFYSKFPTEIQKLINEDALIHKVFVLCFKASLSKEETLVRMIVHKSQESEKRFDALGEMARTSMRPTCIHIKDNEGSRDEQIKQHELGECIHVIEQWSTIPQDYWRDILRHLKACKGFKDECQKQKLAFKELLKSYASQQKEIEKLKKFKEEHTDG